MGDAFADPDVPKPGESDDQALIVRLHAGDESVLELLHHRYWQVLVSSAFRYVRDGELARDIVQDVFMDLWIRRATWYPRGRIVPYLFAAVRNRAISVVRHHRVAHEWEQDVRDVTPLTSRPGLADEVLEADELDTLLRQCLEALPERCRETYLLYRSGDLTLAEVARVMGVSTETAKTQVKRAMLALRETVQRYRA